MGFGFPAPRVGRARCVIGLPSGRRRGPAFLEMCSSLGLLTSSRSGGRARGGDPFDMLMSSMFDGMRSFGGGVGGGGSNTVVQTWSSSGGGGSFREERVVRTSRGGVEETVRTVRDSEEGEEVCAPTDFRGHRGSQCARGRSTRTDASWAARHIL